MVSLNSSKTSASLFVICLSAILQGVPAPPGGPFADLVAGAFDPEGLRQLFGKRRRLVSEDVSAPWDEEMIQLTQKSSCGSELYHTFMVFDESSSHFHLVASPADGELVSSSSPCPEVSMDAFPNEETGGMEFYMREAAGLSKNDSDDELLLGVTTLDEIAHAFLVAKGEIEESSYHISTNNCIHSIKKLARLLELEWDTKETTAFLEQKIKFLMDQYPSEANGVYQTIRKADRGSLLSKETTPEDLVAHFVNFVVYG